MICFDALHTLSSLFHSWYRYFRKNSHRSKKLSPQRNSSRSGYSCRMTRLLPPLSSCTTWAKDSLGGVWIIRCKWSLSKPNSYICHLFIWQHWMNNCSILLAILPINTLLLYLGQKTRWVTILCFVDDPTQYSVMHKSWQKRPQKYKGVPLYFSGRRIPQTVRELFSITFSENLYETIFRYMSFLRTHAPRLFPSLFLFVCHPRILPIFLPNVSSF